MNNTTRRPDKPIAIHAIPGSFSDGWIDYYHQHDVPYRLVDCYRSDIIEVLSDCAGLMWHWSHNDAAAARFARQLTYSLEAKGIPVFPDSQTAWHYDDKLGQKYLFEALNVPHVPSHAFYRRVDAIEFIKQSSFPIVFKLSRGAGSQNVTLVKSRRQAKRLINRSFGRGWGDRNRRHSVTEPLWRFRRDRSLRSAINIVKGIGRAVYPHPAYRARRIESAYAYFQDFIPGNDSDIRVVVIGDRAYGFKRMVRKGDFRASGSGAIVLDPEAVPIECVSIAFESAAKIGMQSAAFDFVISRGKPLVVEVSYAFSAQGATKSVPGYWDRDLTWHSGGVKSEELMAAQFLAQLQKL